MGKYYKLKIKKIKQETQDTITVHLKQPLFNKIKYKSGQFLTVLVTINDEVERRAYSLCSEYQTDTDLMFTVKRVTNGLVSNYLNDHLKAGQKLEIMEPMGSFLFEPMPNANRHIILFGAGSGITPLMSILKSVLLSEANSKVTLVYGNRNESSIIFKEHLDWFKSKYNERFDLLHVLSQSDVTWAEKGRITKSIVQSAMQNINKSDVLFFVCGPEGMQTTVRESLEDFGFPKENVHYESFTNNDVTPINLKNQSLHTQKVTILLDGKKHQIEVNSNQFILDAGLQTGLDLPYSCQSGICTACRGKCQSGKVQMSVEDGLSQSEIDEGYVLTCVAQALSDNIVIEII